MIRLLDYLSHQLIKFEYQGVSIIYLKHLSSIKYIWLVNTMFNAFVISASGVQNQNAGIILVSRNIYYKYNELNTFLLYFRYNFHLCSLSISYFYFIKTLESNPINITVSNIYYFVINMI